MKSYQHGSHFAYLFFAPIVTGVFIPKRVYYLYNVMLSARKKKTKKNPCLITFNLLCFSTLHLRK